MMTVHVQVVVSDQGSPELSSVTEVRVYILDVNDHTPQFHVDHYSVRLPQVPQPLPEVLASLSFITTFRTTKLLGTVRVFY